MPRKETKPIIKALRYFEEAPLAVAEETLAIVEETLRRRRAGETVITGKGPRIDLPSKGKKKPPKRDDAVVDIAQVD